MQNRANYQDLLKTLALVAMLIDHAGLYLMQDDLWMRAVGRFAFPIFAFYAGYNFHGRVKHLLWMLGFIITLVKYPAPDILISITLGQLYLFYAGKAILQDEWRSLRYFLALLLLTQISYPAIEYGTQVIAIMQVGYLCANGKKDEGHLLLAGLVFVIFNNNNFSILSIYDLSYALFFMASILLSVFVLKYADHNRPIPLNLKPISRNMIHIYTITTLGYILVAGFA